MKRFLLPLILGLLACDLAPANFSDHFAPETFSGPHGGSLLYRIYVPKDLAPGRRVPLVLFFHGAGERGSDNVRQLNNGMPQLFAYVEKKNLPVIIIAPQCPSEKQWVDVPWDGDSHTMPVKPSESMRLAMDLLDRSLRRLPVDLKRVYVTGMSMGGFGAWDILQREPALFAAAIPICGGGDPKLAGRIRNVPVWAFHGGADPIVKTTRSRDMTAALKKAGGRPAYTEYPGVGHDAWTQTYADDAVMDWLFAQKKF